MGGKGIKTRTAQTTPTPPRAPSPFTVPLAEHTEGGIADKECLAIDTHPHTFAAGYPGAALALGDLNGGFNAENRC